jgi:hypothetical protein
MTAVAEGLPGDAQQTAHVPCGHAVVRGASSAARPGRATGAAPVLGGEVERPLRQGELADRGRWSRGRGMGVGGGHGEDADERQAGHQDAQRAGDLSGNVHTPGG